MAKENFPSHTKFYEGMKIRCTWAKAIWIKEGGLTIGKVYNLCRHSAGERDWDFTIFDDNGVWRNKLLWNDSGMATFVPACETEEVE